MYLSQPIQLYNTKSESKVNYGLILIMMNHTGLPIVTNVPHLVLDVNNRGNGEKN